MPAPQPFHAQADVRMRGFTERMTVEAALARLDAALSALPRLDAEDVALGEAAGRVLAEDVVSPIDVPSFARAMMDGFAVCSDDTQGASAYNRLPLRIVGANFPGCSDAGRLAAGEAVRIMTGAPLPARADAVLPVEHTELADNRVLVLDQVSPGKHVGQVGEDLRAGEVAARAGRRLRPQDVGLLSSLGCGRVGVLRRPRVRILITGNEVLPAGTPPEGFRIADANGPMLAALVARDGGQLLAVDLIPDDPAAIRAALGQPADILLVSGGSSVGQEDYAPQLLAELGELAVHGVAMRPSSPTGMGSLPGKLVFLLPGNPVSCLCAYDFFAGRAIRVRGGREREWHYPLVRVRLARKLVSVVGRVDYARVQLLRGEAEPLAIGGASVLSTTTRADGFVVVPADSEGYPPGAEVAVYLYQ